MAKNEPAAKAPELPQPGPGEKVFAICYPKADPNIAPIHVCAVNALEAWANFCDGTRQWPSPRLASVTEVK
jgi:hypothetical protein